MPETKCESLKKDQKVEITVLWTCAGILFKERGMVVEMTGNELTYKDERGKLVSISLFNIVDVQSQ